MDGKKRLFSTTEPFPAKLNLQKKRWPWTLKKLLKWRREKEKEKKTWRLEKMKNWQFDLGQRIRVESLLQMIIFTLYFILYFTLAFCRQVFWKTIKIQGSNGRSILFLPIIQPNCYFDIIYVIVPAFFVGFQLSKEICGRIWILQNKEGLKKIIQIRTYYILLVGSIDVIYLYQLAILFFQPFAFLDLLLLAHQFCLALALLSPF